ncbi:hypothetical protein SporoP37_15840 [Sporosarcina sp. P37]|uniref:hypothetical protein n=1 Tax=unclassified Sporosarcina TaxID=2647733 RepID=UPI000A17BD6C|nr:MULTISPECIES: hypothetical protein [unclassified Sporosarcina]ARK25998.1 hypothetical protein SporoP37_15840 [Sporosarcina sp. P37]
MIRAMENIRHNQEVFKKGSLIDGLSSDEAKRLVALKSAEYVISPEEELDIQTAKTEINIDPELFEELRAALDEEYNAEELSREAKAAGVDLTGTTTKKAVIEAIIRQGKADDLLEEASDE